jgi:hypothetical protein
LSPQSMMPEGLLATLQEEDVRNLFLYLRQKQQVPMLVTAVNANDFFNGTDLKGWRASDETAWRVENGELVGKSAGPPVSITSEMAAGDYRLTAQVLVPGAGTTAELVLSGMRDAQRFHGTTFSFGGRSLANLWDYRAAAEPKAIPAKSAVGGDQWHAIEVVRKGESLRVTVDGQVQYEGGDARHRRRVQPAFWLRNGVLRVKGLKIEAP